MSEPIIVDADPAKLQLESALRTTLGGLGAIVAAFGLAKAAGILSIAAGLADPIASVLFGGIAVGSVVWGQFRTRALAAKAAAMANSLPDEVAQAK